MNKFTVSIPVVGRIERVIEAKDEQHAHELAMNMELPKGINHDTVLLRRFPDELLVEQYIPTWREVAANAALRGLLS